MRQGEAISRRLMVGGLLAAPSPAFALASPGAKSRTQLADDLGEMLMLGFVGSTVESASARTLAGQIAAGRAGGVCFVRGNVGGRQDVIGLTRLFASGAASPPLIAIDHEGGAVQRLTERHRFTRLPSAKQVAAEFSPDQARALYARAGTELAEVGFNLNLAPVVDLYDPASTAIGGRGRCFSADPAVVAAYAEACIDGFVAGGVQCALKHFPGAGSARDDSHVDLPDISATWSPAALEPYRRVLAEGRGQVVMSGHFRLGVVEPAAVPTSLSRAVVTSLLRERLGFSGVAMTDDLDMKAVAIPRKDAVIRAIAAGNDLLMVFNQEDYDPDLPGSVLAWVREAIAAGALSETAIAASAARVRRLRRMISAAPAAAK